MKNLCVFGASCSNIDSEFLNAAYTLGQVMAQRGIGLVFGGGNTGLMGAAARGVHDGGGRIIGVIPEKLNRPGVAYPFCGQLIVTPDMHTRKAKMEALSDGFIALPGGYGTLDELCEVITWAQEMGHLKRLELTVQVRNERAVRLYQSCGFDIEGIKKRGARTDEGEWLDLYYMGRLIE